MWSAFFSVGMISLTVVTEAQYLHTVFKRFNWSISCNAPLSLVSVTAAPPERINTSLEKWDEGYNHYHLFIYISIKEVSGLLLLRSSTSKQHS